MTAIRVCVLGELIEERCTQLLKRRADTQQDVGHRPRDTPFAYRLQNAFVEHTGAVDYRERVRKSLSVSARLDRREVELPNDVFDWKLGPLKMNAPGDTKSILGAEP
jgi:hypothetical protein